MTEGIGQPFRPRDIQEVRVDDVGTLQDALDKLSADISPGESRYTQVTPAVDPDGKEVVKVDNPDFLLAVTINEGDPDRPVTDDDLRSAKITMLSCLTPKQNMAILIGAAQRIAEIERHRASKN